MALLNPFTVEKWWSWAYLPLLILLLSLTYAISQRTRIHQLSKENTQYGRMQQFQSKPREATPNPLDAYTDITPHPSLTLSTLPTALPLKLRPFRPKFHLTMAIQSLTLPSLLEYDSTYAQRIALRSQLLDMHRSDVLGLNPIANDAVYELYTWLIGTYLPRRFGGLYTLLPGKQGMKGTEDGGKGLLNRVTGKTLPLHPSSAEEALNLLGRNVDTDFLILLPSTSSPTPTQDPTSPAQPSQPPYHLRAFITLFPSGFRTSLKLNLSLSSIHSPVPGYSQKLEKSMDRFFANLPRGKVVKRENWGITTNGDRLFCLEGNHGVVGDDENGGGGRREEDGEKDEGDGNGDGGKEEDFDINSAVLRCERQTLHRLPETGALVFAFKTYTYPLQELRDEGSGEALAEAIDGLETGSVPGMNVYKRQNVWGKKAKAFLRGEIEA